MRVRIHDLRPGDEQTVQIVFDGLSPRSRYRRFHGPVRELTPRMRQGLADADGHDHVVLVAWAGRGRRRRPVGMVRLVRTGPVVAELAIEVVDAVQARGVGRRLLAAAKVRATTLGIRVVVADVLEDNGAMLRLLRSSFTGIDTSRDGDRLELRCPVPTLELEPADLQPAVLWSA